LSTRDAYVAIADPTRREILGLLRDRGPLIAGEIAARFPSASRPGISRHLRVLRECGVVRCEHEGKTRSYTVDPAPLAEIRDLWLAGFGRMQSASLAALRKGVERRK
jgi:DNA-binding transcriptional ArsR family regulator